MLPDSSKLVSDKTRTVQELTKINQNTSLLESSMKQTLKSKSKEVEKLDNDIANLERKYRKIKEAHDLGKRRGKSADLEIKKIQEKLIRAKDNRDSLESSHQLNIVKQMKLLEDNKVKLIKDKETVEQEIKNLENSLDPFTKDEQL